MLTWCVNSVLARSDGEGSMGKGGEIRGNEVNDTMACSLGATVKVAWARAVRQGE